MNGLSVYCGPEIFDGETDTLYRNNGDGTFTDISESAGIRFAGLGLAAIAGDPDRDGDIDLFVANDMTPNFFYRNRGDGTFEEMGFAAGIALGDDAVMGNSMGFDLADYDNDGWLDLLVTNFEEQTTVLHRNDGDGFFTDVSYLVGNRRPLAANVELGGVPSPIWTTTAGETSLSSTATFTTTFSRSRDGVPILSPNRCFQNLGNGRFRDVSAQSGAPIVRPEVSRGAAFGDYDNDGDLDVIVNNLHSRATLLQNESPPENGWVRVILEPPHWAPGTWLELSTAGRIAAVGSPGSRWGELRVFERPPGPLWSGGRRRAAS
ncbi:MAG: hypothetical protein KatS3mg115_2059 [Candidatus Poribacteria bacterium]|nr:MAG: hypothetical protein KatS3mg115_2059 [Candidatus Poribacteria bacterium]